MSIYLIGSIVVSLGTLAFKPLIQDLIDGATESRRHSLEFFIPFIGVGLPIFGAVFKRVSAGPTEEYTHGSDVGFVIGFLVFITLWVQLGVHAFLNDD